MSISRFSKESKGRYPVCFALCPDLFTGTDKDFPLSDGLARYPEALARYPYLIDLARIEEAKSRLAAEQSSFPESASIPMINPHLDLLKVKWRFLPRMLAGEAVVPEPGDEYVLILKKSGAGVPEVRKASPQDLLALKLVAEQTHPRKAAADGKVSLGAIDRTILRAKRRGLIIGAGTRIKRPDDFPKGEQIDPDLFQSPTFTLQWHITQACDLNCRHCYDRSERDPMPLDHAIGVLDDLYDFCRDHGVFGQVSFSGGNPLLYPYFDRLYTEAAERGFMIAILGNPMPKNRIENMLGIQKPEFYQVSLEGLIQHNDFIRGRGHYERTVDFLKLLGDMGIYRMVMLTLTAGNLDQVLELADGLRGLTELFTFSRLATVGRGADLLPVPVDLFPGFLDQYMEAARLNPVMGFKDNLFNPLLRRHNLPLFGGCAGHGCGAAFNFVSLLPDGQVHACRKFPSLIGNLYTEKLNTLYYSPAAHRYRQGPEACKDCPVRPACGGCLAVSFGSGRDIFKESDPYCPRQAMGL